jgi:BlaI family penicillinase repressor
MEKLTTQEQEAMKALWSIRQGTARQILEAHIEPKPNYNTLRSTLENLKEKNYLSIRVIGNTNEYFSLVKESVYARQFLSQFVKDHFKNSYKELVTFFAQDKRLSQDDLEEIMDIIKNKRSK